MTRCCWSPRWSNRRGWPGGKRATETRGTGFRLLDMQATSKRRTRPSTLGPIRVCCATLSNFAVHPACALAVHAFSWRVTDGYCVYLSSLNGRARFDRLMSRFVRILYFTSFSCPYTPWWKVPRLLGNDALALKICTPASIRRSPALVWAEKGELGRVDGTKGQSLFFLLK